MTAVAAKSTKRRFSSFALAAMPSAEDYKRFARWCEMQQQHIVNLWHQLDKDGSMSLHRKEFLQGLKDLGYDGDLEKLWSFLDRDHTGLISFLEFAPEHAVELARFKLWAVQQHGSLQAAFQSLDTNRNGHVSQSEFIDGCRGQGLPPSLIPSLDTLFLLLNSSGYHNSKGLITQDELAFLDVWQVPPFLWALPDFAAKDRLKSALLRRHQQNALQTWRKELDKDSSMRVNFVEFSNVCKFLARLGMSEASPACGVAALFCALDQGRTGWFSLHDWDAEGYKILRTFTAWARLKHGKVAHFARTLLQGRSTSVGFRTFAGALRGVAIRRADVPYLFDSLCGSRPEHLSVADVGFLDRWNFDGEMEERVEWERSVRKLSLSSRVPPRSRHSRAEGS